LENPIKAIYRWQKDAGNLGNPYDDFLESSFQIEEALEGFELEWSLDLPSSTNRNAKELSRSIVETFIPKEPLTDVDRFDKAIDAVVFAIGSMAKLGLTPQQIQKGLLVVNHYNMQKLGMPRDEHGKLMKPEGFVGPEEELQKILAQRTSND
jgi:hypothetical protein